MKEGEKGTLDGKIVCKLAPEEIPIDGIKRFMEINEDSKCVSSKKFPVVYDGMQWKYMVLAAPSFPKTILLFYQGLVEIKKITQPDVHYAAQNFSYNKLQV